MEKFTKGKWLNNGRLVYCEAIFIATASITDVEYSECEANAALIAAAPEMYEMLKLILSVYELDWDDTEKALTLLAKARGEK